MRSRLDPLAAARCAGTIAAWVMGSFCFGGEAAAAAPASAATAGAVATGRAGPPGGARPFRLHVEDARGDDTGPGGFVYPSGAPYTRGSFDLRRFEVRLEGDEVVFAVTLGAAPRRPVDTRTASGTLLRLDNGATVQNVDIYVDRDPTPGVGYTATVPGRGAELDAAGAWEAAVVLTPQPWPVRTIVEEVMGAAAGSVIVPTDVRAEGPTLLARVPVVALGGEPQESWGWAVLVTGATWEASVGAQDRLTSQHRANAFTMPVVPVAEAEAFGGAPREGWHARVVDLLDPPSARPQAEQLRATADGRVMVQMYYPSPAARIAATNAAATALAEVQRREAAEAGPASAGRVPPRAPPPAVAAPSPTAPLATAAAPPVTHAASSGPPVTPAAPPGPPAAPAAPPGAPLGDTTFALAVTDLQGDRFVLADPDGRAAEGRLGVVLGADGTPVARVVVVYRFPRFAVAAPVDGGERVARGMFVRFELIPSTSEASPP